MTDLTWLRVLLRRRIKILILEDSQARIDWFVDVLFPGHDLHIYKNAREAIHRIRADEDWDLILLDHDLEDSHYGVTTQDAIIGDEERYLAWQTGNWRGSLTGYNFAEALALLPWSFVVPIIIHSMNPVGSKLMNDALPNAARIPFDVLKRC